MTVQKAWPFAAKDWEAKALYDGLATKIIRPLEPAPKILLLGCNDWAWLEEDGHWVVMGRPGESPYYSATLSQVYESPFGLVGDKLWLREAWHHNIPRPGAPGDFSVVYRADKCPGCQPNRARWRGATTMPREFSRTLLTVKKVDIIQSRVLLDADAQLSGIEYSPEYLEQGWQPGERVDSYKAGIQQLYGQRTHLWVVDVTVERTSQVALYNALAYDKQRARRKHQVRSPR